ncbi:acetoacetate--CoA ligase [Arenicella chitinivorans]|nr:acetoacetate--CoA ligase [Arenicella chitinivorans]
MSTPLWQPDHARIEQAKLTQFARQHNFEVSDYQSLWQWSVDHCDAFWSSLWDFCDVVGSKGQEVMLSSAAMTDTKWFPAARLNYAENLLKGARTLPSDQSALVFWGEDKVKRQLNALELHAAVSQCQQLLQAKGVQQGDRVAAFLPNSIDAIIAMLATSSLGAIWCSASPDFGADGVLDRFGQIEPKVLLCSDGYYYGGKWLDCRDKNRAVAAALPSLTASFCIDYHARDECAFRTELAQFPVKEIEFAQLPFDHPLFIMFSSGTTGKPKCIVHGAGGTLLQHLKEHQLHSDIHPGDRLFYFTTCGWMMWNWLASGLASGATIVLYDGNPFAGRKQVLFDLAEQNQVTHFGTSAKFIEACNKTQLKPKETHDLSRLRAVFSTGSPLAPESFRYVYEHIKRDLHLASISGGTDIISCFALGNPTQAVWLGELQCLGLGMAVNAFDHEGQPTKGKGDLVCTKPFPSMPVGFWNDDGGQRYHNAYFATYDNIWCHGDFVELTDHEGQTHPGMIIHGRSDAVLNPGGVRIGTAEIYRQVEKIPEVAESIVVGQDWQNDVRVVLFVKLQDDTELTTELQHKIKQLIRDKATPRHVPAKILTVTDIPRTKSGKIVELAVRDVVHGREVSNLNSLANPEALAYFKNRFELTT